MTRIKTLLFLFFVALLANAEEKDSVKLQVNYATKVTLYIGQPQPKDDEMILEVGERYVHFYSRYSVERDHIRDSVLAAGGTIGDVQSAWAQSAYPRAPQHYQIWKNYPSKGVMTFTDKILRTFKYTETMQRPVWQLVSQDSTIVGYPCQKATTTFHGRTWTAWFTYDIPVAEGPWELCGLPGLILRAEDSDHLFRFECVELKVNPKREMAFPKQKCVDCTKEDYIKIVKQMYQDPDALVQKIAGFKSEGFDAQGRKLQRTPKTAVLLENE